MMFLLEGAEAGCFVLRLKIDLLDLFMINQ